MKLISRSNEDHQTVWCVVAALIISDSGEVLERVIKNEALCSRADSRHRAFDIGDVKIEVYPGSHGRVPTSAVYTSALAGQCVCQNSNKEQWYQA
jgi:hypothetical protein